MLTTISPFIYGFYRQPGLDKIFKGALPIGVFSRERLSCPCEAVLRSTKNLHSSSLARNPCPLRFFDVPLKHTDTLALNIKPSQ
jgi:hypothetical protein